MRFREFDIFKRAFVVFCSAMLLGTGCARMPKEASELSAELGSRISAIQSAHLSLLHTFFEERRRAVDQFIGEVWAPDFENSFLSNPTIDKAWQEIVRSNSKEDRLKFLLMVGPKLQDKINEKRVELMTPLDELERLLERTLNDEYRQAQAINNSITSFLLSASKVAENRDRFLKQLGMTDERVTQVIDNIDGAVGFLQTTAKDIGEKQELAKKYLIRLKEIRETLGR